MNQSLFLFKPKVSGLQNFLLSFGKKNISPLFFFFTTTVLLHLFREKTDTKQERDLMALLVCFCLILTPLSVFGLT